MAIVYPQGICHDRTVLHFQNNISMMFSFTRIRAPFLLNISMIANLSTISLDWSFKHKINHMYYFIITGKQICYSGWKAELCFHGQGR